MKNKCKRSESNRLRKCSYYFILSAKWRCGGSGAGPGPGQREGNSSCPYLISAILLLSPPHLIMSLTIFNGPSHLLRKLRISYLNQFNPSCPKKTGHAMRRRSMWRICWRIFPSFSSTCGLCLDGYLSDLSSYCRRVKKRRWRRDPSCILLPRAIYQGPLICKYKYKKLAGKRKRTGHP